MSSVSRQRGRPSLDAWRRVIPSPKRYAPRSEAFSPCCGGQVGLTVTYPLAVIADVATGVCSSRARLRCASSTRIVVMCKMIEKGTMYAGNRTIGHWVNTEVGRVGMHHGESLGC